LIPSAIALLSRALPAGLPRPDGGPDPDWAGRGRAPGHPAAARERIAQRRSSTLLESLDSIDWGSLDGWYGPAAAVPGVLRSFLTPIAEIRDWAIEEISSAVFHQGTIYSASPAVIPFLFELLENEEVRDKEEVVTLLTAMAGCCVYEETDPEFRRRID